MIKLINEMFTFIGWALTSFVLIELIIKLIQLIFKKIKDFKDRKTVIKKGTIFFLDGKRVVLKKDLELKFKKVKYTECVCDNFRELPTGVERGTRNKLHRKWAKTNFETNLLNMYKDFPNRFNHIVEYQDNKGE